MKKTYISPEALTVLLGTCTMTAESFNVHTEDGAPAIDNANDILTKENKDVNLWDNEW